MPASSTKAHAIAIDGPVASGKSAVGGRVASELGYRFVDTGMMYRALTVVALDRRTDLDDEEALARLAEGVTLRFERGGAGGERIVVDGEDVTDELRSARVGESVSLVSRVAGVRRAMVALQRELAREGGVVMVGRDIGTVVLPDAPVKVYLDASAEVRVRRRHEELAAAGREADAEMVRRELAQRDELDSGRAASPLRPAEDAVHIDTDALSLDEVVGRILELVSCR